jgi:hypothetical protein
LSNVATFCEQELSQIQADELRKARRKIMYRYLDEHESLRQLFIKQGFFEKSTVFSVVPYEDFEDCVQYVIGIQEQERMESFDDAVAYLIKKSKTRCRNMRS